MNWVTYPLPGQMELPGIPEPAFDPRQPLAPSGASRGGFLLYIHPVPITPLHFGPALLIKRAIGARFSLLAFACSQVLLDIEPGLKLFGLIPENGGLHTGHTWPIGAGVAVLSVAVARGYWWARCQPCRIWAEGLGASFGVASHLLLDALYHADVAAAVFFPCASVGVPRAALDGALLAATFAGLALLYKKPV